jgi:CheY-like chemotaxis protein
MPGEILVVDDDVSVHRFLMMFLEARGHIVRTASSVDQALAELHASHVDAIVLDVKMPPRSGLDVLKHVREDEILRDLPVLILTGTSFTPDEEALIASLRAYVFYKQESDLDELGSYIERVTPAEPPTGARAG